MYFCIKFSWVDQYTNSGLFHWDNTRFCQWINLPHWYTTNYNTALTNHKEIPHSWFAQECLILGLAKLLPRNIDQVCFWIKSFHLWPPGGQFWYLYARYVISMQFYPPGGQFLYYGPDLLLACNSTPFSCINNIYISYESNSTKLLNSAQVQVKLNQAKLGWDGTNFTRDVT